MQRLCPRWTVLVLVLSAAWQSLAELLEDSGKPQGSYWAWVWRAEKA